MNEDIVVPALFCATVIILALGIPLVRAFTRKQERSALSTPLSPELAMRDVRQMLRIIRTELVTARLRERTG